MPHCTGEPVEISPRYCWPHREYCQAASKKRATPETPPLANSSDLQFRRIQTNFTQCYRASDRKESFGWLWRALSRSERMTANLPTSLELVVEGPRYKLLKRNMSVVYSRSRSRLRCTPDYFAFFADFHIQWDPLIRPLNSIFEHCKRRSSRPLNSFFFNLNCLLFKVY